MKQWIIDAVLFVIDLFANAGMEVLAKLADFLSEFGVDLQPFVTYVEIANMWAPISECMVAIPVYYTLAALVRIIRWILLAIPTIWG